jgi:hypothetical protein
MGKPVWPSPGFAWLTTVWSPFLSATAAAGVQINRSVKTNAGGQKLFFMCELPKKGTCWTNESERLDWSGTKNSVHSLVSVLPLKAQHEIPENPGAEYCHK